FAFHVDPKSFTTMRRNRPTHIEGSSSKLSIKSCTTAPAAWRCSREQLGGRAPARLSSNRHTAVRPGVCLSIALVPGNFCVLILLLSSYSPRSEQCSPGRRSKSDGYKPGNRGK